MKPSATVYYNPRCGTCQKVKALLEGKGFALQLVEYLRTPPAVTDLDRLCRLLGVEPQALARQGEPVYATVAAKAVTREQWLQALHEHPELIQRPIVVIGERAVIARPPETLEPFLRSIAG